MGLITTGTLLRVALALALVHETQVASAGALPRDRFWVEIDAPPSTGTGVGADRLLQSPIEAPPADVNVAAAARVALPGEGAEVEGEVGASATYGITFNFDDISLPEPTAYLYPRSYGSLFWSKNFWAHNFSSAPITPYNVPSSPPNQLYVQDSTFSGGSEPSIEISPSSAAESFDLHSISALPVNAALTPPVLMAIRGTKAVGGAVNTRWYIWQNKDQLKYPWKDIKVDEITACKKVEIYMIPGDDQSSTKRLPYTLDDINIQWRDIEGGVISQEPMHQGL